MTDVDSDQQGNQADPNEARRCLESFLLDLLLKLDHSDCLDRLTPSNLEAVPSGRQ